ncbi:hypothetical protein GGR56DRAFT_412474 [Xylariaceae sp. FL0804]|nr:hypothetical protein GGR56DRAFT_412474 [Xylariaceae sp. FL0804]
MMDIASLRISASSRLDSLPTDVLLVILSYLDTARSLARLGSTCRGLHQLVLGSGWRIFVTSCFRGLSLPPAETDRDWEDLARSLTAQSWDWDRRAFVFHSLSPPERGRHNGRRHNNPASFSQSIPGNIIVDAHQRRVGRNEEELVIWGAGEDVIARVRQKYRTKICSEAWHSHKGDKSGFRAGKGDITSVSIVKGPFADQHDSPQVLVGRANGDVRLLSMDGSNFGHTTLRFRPSSPGEHAVEQREIQSLDHHGNSGRLATGTRENILLYQPGNPDLHEADSDGTFSAKPVDTLALKKADGSAPFEFIRSIKFVNQETLAVSLNRSFKPVQYLTLTPTGMQVSGAANVVPEYPTVQSNPRTVRALLPVDVSSVASGGGNALLSSWDDGTIRLQDLRTPCAVDRVYQDNFEVSTPINALISHGLERFVAGSAYSHMLKIFDFRWSSSFTSTSTSTSGSISTSSRGSKGYYHTDSLPCGRDRPYPTPRPPTVVAEPAFFPDDDDDDRARCDHVRGRPCRWHALSRHDFYRPNCNVYLPFFRGYAGSPIYSLARPSDASPALYAGLSGLLVELTLKSGIVATSADDDGNGAAANANANAKANPPPLYAAHRGKVAILETGDGSVVSDVTKCLRVPEIRRQSFSGDHHAGNAMARRRHRLDESLQNPSEWPPQEETVT